MCRVKFAIHKHYSCEFILCEMKQKKRKVKTSVRDEMTVSNTKQFVVLINPSYERKMKWIQILNVYQLKSIPAKNTTQNYIFPLITFSFDNTSKSTKNKHYPITRTMMCYLKFFVSFSVQISFCWRDLWSSLLYLKNLSKIKLVS